MEDHYRHGWGPAATAVASLEGVEGRLALHEAQSIDGRLSPYERGHGRMSPYDARDGRLSPYDSGSGRTSPFEGGSGRGMSPYGTREGSLSPYEGTSGRGSPYERGSASASPYEARGHGSYQDRARGSPHSGLSPQMLLRPPAMPRACYSGEQALCASMAQVRAARDPQLPVPDQGSSMGPRLMGHMPWRWAPLFMGACQGEARHMSDALHK